MSVTSYKIKRSLTQGGPYTTIETVLDPTTFFLNTDLDNGATYYYVVSAVNENGEGIDSAEVIGSPVAPPEPPPEAPPAPGGLVATPGDAQVSLDWNASAGADTYKVKRSPVPGGPYTTIASGLSVTEYINIGLVNGTTYYYVVSAVNEGGESANSSEVSATPTAPVPPPSAPPPPGGLVAVPGNTTVSLDWNASAEADTYKVKRSLVHNGPYTVIAPSVVDTNYLDTGLTNGTTYYYVVSAVNENGESANSSEVNAEPSPPEIIFPQGIVMLPSTISPVDRIGDIDDNPWLHPSLDGVRIRLGWHGLEPEDGVYDWDLIDECLGLAEQSGTWLGLGVIAGVGCPGWLFGGQKFTGTVSGTSINSSGAGFTSADLNRYVFNDWYPDRYSKIVNVSGNTATVDIAAGGGSHSNSEFWVLNRTGPGSEKLLMEDGSGLNVIPWDETYKTKWFRFIAAFGARYDSNPLVRYIPMGGLGKTGEAHYFKGAQNVADANASAIAHGFTASGGKSAGVNAYLDAAKDTFDAYMDAFPTKPPFLTIDKPFPTSSGGDIGRDELIAYGISNYPRRLGLMCSQLSSVTTTNTDNFAPIFNNHASQPTGVQPLSNCQGCNRTRMSKCNGVPLGCDNWGNNPCLTSLQAYSNSCDRAFEIKCRYMETYNADLNSSELQATIAAKRLLLLSIPPPQ